MRSTQRAANSERSRQLRAVLRNGLTWGIAWGLAGGTLFAVARLLDPGAGSLVARLGGAALAGVAWGFRFALSGAVIGTLFAGAIRFGFRGRRLADISAVRFTLLGALVGGAGVPLFLQLMNVLSGDGPIAWHLVLDDAPWAAVFGGVAAAGSILVARRAEARGPAHETIGETAADSLSAGPLNETVFGPGRERAAADQDRA